MHLAWERGPGWKYHQNHHKEEEERPGGGRWVTADSAGGGGTVGSNTEPEESGGRSSASFPCSFVKPLCQSLRQVSQKETSDPSTPVASLKGLRWKTQPLQAQPMSSLGTNPIRALAPTDFKEPLPSGVVALL